MTSRASCRSRASRCRRRDARARRLLGATPIRDRLVDAEAPEPDAVVISATLWRTAFEKIVGRTVGIEDEPRVLIGALRTSATLVLVFAVVALIASAGGLFSVLSHAVQERRREFGIRSALGATPAAIARVVYREGMLVGVIGLLLGAGLAMAFASILEAVSYEASASDPVGVSIVVVTLVGTIVLALWRPARDAARTDPALLLKDE